MPPSALLLRDHAYEAICQLITSGELAMGEPLSERSLAQRLAISRTPVREAMKALVRDGVVTSQLGRGTYLRTLEPHEIRSLYEVRQALEGAAATLAARHGPSAALAQLAERMAAMQSQPSSHSAVQIDEIGERFHDEIFNAANNPILFEVFEPLRLRFHVAFSLMRRHEHAVLHDTLAEHLRIFDAIARRDEVAAHAAMTEHLDRGRDARMQILEQLKATTTAPPKTGLQPLDPPLRRTP